MPSLVTFTATQVDPTNKPNTITAFHRLKSFLLVTDEVLDVEVEWFRTEAAMEAESDKLGSTHVRFTPTTTPTLAQVLSGHQQLWTDVAAAVKAVLVARTDTFPDAA